MKIIHVMSDGTIRDSVEGLVVPASISLVYQILANHRPGQKRTEDLEADPGAKKAVTLAR